MKFLSFQNHNGWSIITSLFLYNEYKIKQNTEAVFKMKKKDKTNLIEIKRSIDKFVEYNYQIGKYNIRSEKFIPIWEK